MTMLEQLAGTCPAVTELESTDLSALEKPSLTCTR